MGCTTHGYLGSTEFGGYNHYTTLIQDFVLSCGKQKTSTGGFLFYIQLINRSRNFRQQYYYQSA